MRGTIVRLVSTHKGKYWAAEYRDSAGRRKYRGLGAKDETPKREALRRMADFQATLVIQPGIRDADGRTTLGAWCARYLAIRTDLAESTLVMAQDTIGRLKEHFGEDCRMDRITPARATDFHNWLKIRPNRRKTRSDAPGLISEASVARYIRDAKGIFTRAVREHIIAANPFAHVDAGGGGASEDWQIIDLAHLDKILAACPSAPWRCLFALCRLAGLRLGARGGEALGLTWGDVDWDRRTMLVWDQKRGRQRIVPIQPKLYGILRESFEAAPDGSTEVCTMSGNNLHRNALAIIKAAGLPAYSKPFHTLRKNLETEWLEAHPLPTVCKWLGNSPAVAMKHYHRADTASTLARVTTPAGPGNDTVRLAGGPEKGKWSVAFRITIPNGTSVDGPMLVTIDDGSRPL